jgi:phage anti-repressor protein
MHNEKGAAMSEKNNNSQTDQLMSKAEHLLKIAQNKVGMELLETVNARELHAFLGVGKDFSTWIRDRIEIGIFVENQDFTIFPNFGENSSRGRPSKEYYISIDMAKHLAMLERNERGRQAREYFIACEKKLKVGSQGSQPLLDPELQALVVSLQRLDVVKAEQEKQAIRLNIVEEQQRNLQLTNGHANYFSILGYASYIGVRIDLKRAKVLGKIATRTCIEEGVQYGETPDQRFGRVNTYPSEILESLFKSYNQLSGQKPFQ